MSIQSEAPRRRIGFEPGLEGLRGLVLLGVLLYHAQFTWAKGGFLGIPTFFTLSGYLITLLLLAEWESAGRIDLLRFWERRFRRLMPAALLTLLLMTAFGTWAATTSQVRGLEADVRWSLFYAANWHFLFSNASYAAMFEAPSPLQHFWSLAIEEQFYLVFPLVAVAGLWLGKGSRKVFFGVLSSLALASIAAALVLNGSGASTDRIYYGTDTRAVELLLGALAAVVLPATTQLSQRAARVVQTTGGLALVAMIAGWSTINLYSSWLYAGGFAAYSLLSVAVIAAAIQPKGVVRAVLSHSILRWIGRISYGAYVFHWPIYLTLTADRTGLGDVGLFALRLSITFALAALSLRWLENPVRRGQFLAGRAGLAALPVAFAVVWIAVSLVPKPQSSFAVDLENLDAYVDGFIRSHTPPTDPPPPTLSSEAPRVAFFGDSTALRLGIGFHYAQEQTGAMHFSRGAARLGCGVVRKGLIRTGSWEHRELDCPGFQESWARAIRQEQPDIAVVMSASWDLRDRRLPGDTTWRSIGDPTLDRYLRDELLAATDVLSKDGSLVVWLTHPAIAVRLFDEIPDEPFPASDPVRIDRWNAMILELEQARPEKVRVIDLRGYLHSLPGGEMNEDYRPDGTHLSRESAYQVSVDWLSGEVLRVYREQASHAKGH